MVRHSAAHAAMMAALGLTLVAGAARAQSAPASEAGNDTISPGIDDALLHGRFAEAAALLARRAKAGNAEAQYQLASLYRTGRGVPADEGLAFRWMQAAAQQGHVRAQFDLGAMYLAGRGVARNLIVARIWL